MTLHPVNSIEPLIYLEPGQWLSLRHKLQRWGIPTLDLDMLEAGGVMPESTCRWISDELWNYFQAHSALFKRDHEIETDELWLDNGMLPAVVESLELWKHPTGGVITDG